MLKLIHRIRIIKIGRLEVEEDPMRNEKNKKIILSVLGILSLVIITIGATYARFTYTRLGTTDNTITTGTLKFLYTENSKGGTGISITEAFPITDTEGKNLTGDNKVFDFKVEGTNTGKDEIPVYRGDEDWKVESKYGETFDMTGQVIAPFDKVKRKFIKQRIQTISEEEKNLDYLLHLNWMINPNEIPEKRKQREVVSLTTGEISQENQKSLTQ